MARKTKTVLTFAVTVEMPSGANIPMVRNFIKDACGLQRDQLAPDTPMFAFRTDNMKVHLTNKEVSYG